MTLPRIENVRGTSSFRAESASRGSPNITINLAHGNGGKVNGKMSFLIFKRLSSESEKLKIEVSGVKDRSKYAV